MGHKKVKIYDIGSLAQEDKDKLVNCVCGNSPIFKHDPAKALYIVECSRENCPGKAMHKEKSVALKRWYATVSPAIRR